MMLRFLPILIILSCLGLCADEVRMIDGRTLEGEIISKPDADVVDLRTSSGGITVVQHLPKHQIAAITFGTTPRQKELEGIAKACAALGDGGTAAEWFALVERAKAVGDGILAKNLANEVVLRDRHHVNARKILGHVSYRGVWMRPYEAGIAQGHVLHDGRAVTWEEREALIAKAEADQAANLARREQREQDRRERLLRAAASETALNPTYVPYSSYAYDSSSYGYGSYGYGSGYRAVYWPPVCAPAYPVYPSHHSGGTIRIGASGGSGGFGWNFRWNSGW